jgi:hypothetical protein
MPFTFSHPAIVLPFWNLKKYRLSVTGLITGSMVPDFEFLFRLRETDILGHTLLGIIIFDIPVAVLLSFVFHLLVRNGIILHLPKSLRQRLAVYTFFNWKACFRKNVIWFFISVLLGLASHFFLDAFTHSYGVFVKMSPFFTTEVRVWQYAVPVYYFLQLILSIIGAVYIFWFVLKMKKGPNVNLQNSYLAYWSCWLILGLVFFVLRLYAYPQYHSTDDIIIAFTGCFVYALLIVSVYFTHYTKKIKKAL